ncbi:MAG: hypothetical protein II685_00985 [Clostridia bacterium]|nr:hypothetical protein [Clostridia bacterium]
MKDLYLFEAAVMLRQGLTDIEQIIEELEKSDEQERQRIREEEGNIYKYADWIYQSMVELRLRQSDN